jgi:hypothetical protein
LPAKPFPQVSRTTSSTSQRTCNEGFSMWLRCVQCESFVKFDILGHLVVDLNSFICKRAILRE